MPRGGARKGAGRRRGTLNQKTREIAEEAVRTGLTPLEVMLTAMRVHVDSEEWDKASAVAKDAAPYVHPRLAAIEHSGPDGGPIKTKDVSDLTRARALVTFMAKVKAQ